MKILSDKIRLYCIAGSEALPKGKNIEESVSEAIAGGADVIQMREKNMPYAQKLVQARRLKKICTEKKIPFIINDCAELAYESGADGVHLGRNDDDIQTARKLLGQNAIIGATAHNCEEAVEAAENGADYIGAGAVFVSPTKNDTVPLSFNELKKICGSVEIPVVAIGGINTENIYKLAGSGISGAAVISAVFQENNIVLAARNMKQAVLEIIGDTL
ncbi:MAG: thiamine phosphate synthase [Oscillospiraceae bacterium]|nr:thiamine phosphate synthase [Oscillospiraceae bacterium]